MTNAHTKPATRGPDLLGITGTLRWPRTKLYVARQGLEEAEQRLSAATSRDEQLLAFIAWNACKRVLTRITEGRAR